MENQFFTVLTKDAFSISFKEIPLMKVEVLEQKFSPKKQVQENMRRANQIKSQLLSGSYPITEIQNKFNSII